MTKKKEVAVQESFGVAERPDWMKTESNRGSEEVTNQDVTLPRLQIIQDLSPQHKKSKDEYIEGSEVGDFFNTVSQQLYKESTLFVPVYFKTEYIIWKDQKAGGGFFGAFETELEAKQAFNDAVKEGGGNADEYEIVDTNVHFVLLVDSESDPSNPKVEQVVISMSKSQSKVSRNLNSMVRMAGGDRFSRLYRLKTVEDTNKAGQEYQNWSVKPVGFVSEALYKLGEATYEAVKSGSRKVDYGEAGEKQSKPMAETSDGELEDEFAV